jgi:hypothetical protein
VLIGQPVAHILTQQGAERVDEWIRSEFAPEDVVLLNFVTVSREPYTLSCVVQLRQDRLVIIGEPDLEDNRATAEELFRLNNELAVLGRERARASREIEQARRELQRALDDLRTSHWHIRKIQEVLPICMECHQVKTPDLKWETVTEYLRANKILVSHGYCPPCSETVMRRYGLLEDT